MQMAANGGLAAHFQAKRRLPGDAARQPQAGALAAAPLSLATPAFRFDFDVREAAAPGSSEPMTTSGTTKKKRKSKKKKEKKKKTTGEQGDPLHRPQIIPGDARDVRVGDRETGGGGAESQTMLKREAATARGATRTGSTGGSSSSSTFLKLRKATGSESEVARMHLRYGQGRRNLVATAQREHRRRLATGSATPAQAADSGGFRFDFTEPSE